MEWEEFWKNWREVYKDVPELRDNEGIARTFYEMQLKQSKSEVVEKYPSEAEIGEWIEFRACVLRYLGERFYYGCPECRKKECNHNLEKRKFVSRAYLVSFGGGEKIIVATRFELAEKLPEESEYKEGDLIRIRGKLSEWRGEKRLEQARITLLARPNDASKILLNKKNKGSEDELEEKRKAFFRILERGGLDVQTAKSFAKSVKVDWSDIEKIITIKDGKVFVVAHSE